MEIALVFQIDQVSKQQSRIQGLCEVLTLFLSEENATVHASRFPNFILWSIQCISCESRLRSMI